MAQWSGRHSLDGRLSLTYTRSNADWWPLSGKTVCYESAN